ncbi:MAG: amino acid adenylation domain-containing protein [Alphaproteobacteria bacterium]|nr:amino acid adenylation domain-containing protein [Alphaproteobacteria bacterium]
MRESRCNGVVQAQKNTGTAAFTGFTDEFRRIAAQFPDNTAVLTDGQAALSYAELDTRAQAVSAALSDCPAGIVAVALPKSADYVVAALGCWYAGRAFMPLDPALPAARRDFILRDAAPATVIGREEGKLRMQDMPAARFTPVSLSPETTAYVIYTSGSTGEPKGVVVPHRGLVFMLRAQIAAFGLGPQSRSLFYLSTGFDASVSDIGTALLSGACLCIETGERLALAANLPEIVAARGITYMDIPPSLLRVTDPAKMPATLQTVVIGGEPCPPGVVRDWAARVNLVNVYGPTEATVCTSLCRCDPESWERPLIGAPLPGVIYHILDAEGREAQESELCIGGRQLADGYLNRPALTAQKFVLRCGERIYRTGDLVRRHANGDIEFLGRLDRQVKINGQLVELEEVEGRIARLPGVARAAALKRSQNGRDILAAFVCPAPGQALSAAVLSSALKTCLPAWMVPASFEFLNEMPQTASGKIDYRALESIVPVPYGEEGKDFKPVTQEEEDLLAAWQKVLKKTRIPADKSFFSLGGDSIAALELTLEAERRGVNLTPALVYDFQTLQAQAQWLAAPVTVRDALQSPGMEAQALRRDAMSDGDFRDLLDMPAPAARPAPKLQNVFFTGATGFLGSALLRRLLEEGDAHVHALVRAESDEQARARLGLPEDLQERVTPVRGDLALSRFGLARDDWDALAQGLDTVIHGAATVNVVLPYAALRPANLCGTATAARLTLEGAPKRLHYFSTLSVFVATERNTGRVFEDDALQETRTVYGGYAQSKWAAEVLLHHIPALAAGLSVYRPGLVCGDTRSGAASAHDFLAMFVRGLLSIGAVPEGGHDRLMLDVTPVDYAARALSHIIRAGEAGTFHIANTRGFSLKAILAGLARAERPVAVLPRAQWLAAMQSREREGLLSADGAAAFMALCRCMPRDIFERYRAMDLFQATGIAFDMARTDKALEGSGIVVPAADDALLDIYLGRILDPGA